MKKINILIAFLVLVIAFFLANTLRLHNLLQQAQKTNQAALVQQLASNEVKVKKEFEEKHQADMVSYDAMAKRLEIERGRVAELTKKIEALEKNQPKEAKPGAKKQ